LGEEGCGCCKNERGEEAGGEFHEWEMGEWTSGP
jgi:hypothetical protein